ncbi:MAG: carbohydrate ABC transporter permease [Spirochaetaceae bacterium]|nr:carbohydrate ABC transporter permease [Spirochaetaceae bacterium]MDT8297456.1 carbohydrate ABC transporter permease [Spirochaetaceae bacterium]
MSKSKSKQELLQTVLTQILLIAAATVILIPLYWVLKTSLTGENLYSYPPSVFPVAPHLFNYVDVFFWIPFARFALNSVVVSGIVVAANLVFNSMAAMALTYDFKLKGTVIAMYLGSMMIPFQTAIIPAFLLTRDLGLLNTHLGLAMPLLATIVNIFVFKSSFDAVPKSIIDSTRIDGLSEWRLLDQIYLPLAGPAIATNIILAFVWSWNNFIWPLIIVRDEAMQTLPLALSRFLSYFEDTSGQLYAFVVLVAIPVILIFLANQKRFVKGILAGAVKG